jgi:hypothetical protein
MRSIELNCSKLENLSDCILTFILDASGTASLYETVTYRPDNTNTLDQYGIDASNTDTFDPMQLILSIKHSARKQYRLTGPLQPIFQHVAPYRGC